MKLLKKILSVVLAFTMVISMVNMNTSVYAASADDYIKQLISYYKTYQEDAKTDISRVLEELKEVDQAKGEAWEKIMNYWSYVNSDGYVNEVDILDTGLADTEDLPVLDIDDSNLAIIVLGFALNDDGTMKDELIGRLQVGKALADQYPDAYIIVTGGGTAANNSEVTEGGLMGEWLIEQGIDESRVIIENNASNTVGNALNTYTILNTEYTDVDSVIMVTSDYHVPRGSILFYSKFVLEALNQGGKEIKIVSNAGNETGSNGYESLSLQVSGVCSVAGISTSSLPTVELSTLSGLTVSQNTMYETGNDLDLKVVASYDSGYSQEITDYTITGFDNTLDETQTIIISYEENGVEVTAEYQLNTKQQYSSAYTSLLESLIDEVESMNLEIYSSASIEVLNYALTNAKEVLASSTFEKELKDAYDALILASESLVELENIALNKTASASHNSAEAYKVVDGSLSTYWQGYESANIPIEDSAVYVDLEGLYSLNTVNVTPYYKTNNRYYNFEVYASEDNETWEFVGEYKDTVYSTEDGYTFTLDEPISARYIKVQGVSVYVEDREDINNFHICEIRAYGTLLEEVQVPENLAIYGKVETSGGTYPHRLTDGSTANSYFTSTDAVSTGNVYATVELPKVASIESVNIVTYYNNTSKWYTYEVLVSKDNETWTSIGSYESETNAGSAGYTITLDEPVEGKYVKVKALDTNNTYLHLIEISAYGCLENVALNKGVTVNYERSGYPATRVTDGDLTQHWDTGDVVSDVSEWETLAEEDKPYAIIDLESTYILDTINVLTYKNSSRYYHYDVYTSEDGETYTLYGSKEDSEISSYGTSLHNEVKARYIKVVGNLCSVQKGFHLCEVRAYGVEYSDTNYALHGNVTVNNGTNPSYVTDGNKPARGNYWASTETADQSYCIIELTEYVSLNKIVVIPYYYKSNYYYNYEVLVSSDNINWTTVATYTDQTGGYTVEGQIFTLETPIEARYIKIQGIASNNNNLIHIVEVEAYGTPAKEALADYTAVNEAIAKVPEDLSVYTTESVVALKTLIANIDYTKGISQQETVNQYAEDIENAINALVSRDTITPADFTALNEAINRAEQLDETLYTNYDTVSELLDTAYALLISASLDEQSTVDQAADNLNAAIDVLTYKAADYTAVEEAIAKIPADLTIYTEASVEALNSAVDAVDYNLNITQQDTVDTYAKAIEDAINNLEENTEVSNLASGKTPTVNWADGTTCTINPDCPATNITDGTINTYNYCDFGEDNNTNGAYIQIDLGKTAKINEIDLYRYWNDGRTYKNTVIALSTDEYFSNPYIVYNTDTSNVHGLGTGTDDTYTETSEGKTFVLDETVKARYVRVYMNGSTSGTTNHIVELEVYGHYTAMTVFDENSVFNAKNNTDSGSYLFEGYYDSDKTTLIDAATFFAGTDGYAKYVNPEVLTVKGQAKANEDGTYTFRFVSSVTSINLDKVGFEITKGGTTKDISTTKVYKKILATEGGEELFVNPETVFNAESEYFFVVKVNNVPADATDEIVITPYWIPADGTNKKIYGTERTFTATELISSVTE